LGTLRRANEDEDEEEDEDEDEDDVNHYADTRTTP
jgi:hypothetical protein